MAKVKERKEAVRLRRRGMSYAEILEHVKVSRGTLSAWLRGIKLVPVAQKRLDKRVARFNTTAGDESKSWWKKHRAELYEEACVEMDGIKFTPSTLAYVGAALYWAEGTKDLGMSFSNSDVAMLQLYLDWLHLVLGVPHDRIRLTVHVYLNNGLTLEEIEDYWSRELDIPRDQFYKTVVNRLPKSSQQKTRNVLVYGTVKINVRKPLEYAAKLVVLLERMGKPTQFVDLSAQFR